jgi:hypothetical protein
LHHRPLSSWIKSALQPRRTDWAPTEIDQHGRPTRSLRIRYLCRDDPSGDIVDAFVQIIERTYGSLHGVKHKRRQLEPIVVQRLIPTVEAVLTFVLAR